MTSSRLALVGSLFLPTSVALAVMPVPPPLAQTGQTNAPSSVIGNANVSQVPPEVEKALQMPEGPDRIKALTSAGRNWAQKDPHGSTRVDSAAASQS
jgi:hypothetical protein